MNKTKQNYVRQNLESAKGKFNPFKRREKMSLGKLWDRLMR